MDVGGDGIVGGARLADDIPTGEDVGEGGVFQTAGGGVGVEEATGILETQR